MTRSIHDDTAGPTLSEADLEVQKVLIDAEAGVEAVITRLKNFAEKRPDMNKQPWFFTQRIWDLDSWLRGAKGLRKARGM